jgi:hypothetical protein
MAGGPLFAAPGRVDSSCPSSPGPLVAEVAVPIKETQLLHCGPEIHQPRTMSGKTGVTTHSWGPCL